MGEGAREILFLTPLPSCFRLTSYFKKHERATRMVWAKSRICEPGGGRARYVSKKSKGGFYYRVIFYLRTRETNACVNNIEALGRISTVV